MGSALMLSLVLLACLTWRSPVLPGLCRRVLVGLPSPLCRSCFVRPVSAVCPRTGLSRHVWAQYLAFSCSYTSATAPRRLCLVRRLQRLPMLAASWPSGPRGPAQVSAWCSLSSFSGTAHLELHGLRWLFLDMLPGLMGPVLAAGPCSFLQCNRRCFSPVEGMDDLCLLPTPPSPTSGWNGGCWARLLRASPVPVGTKGVPPLCAAFVPFASSLHPSG